MKTVDQNLLLLHESFFSPNNIEALNNLKKNPMVVYGESETAPTAALSHPNVLHYHPPSKNQDGAFGFFHEAFALAQRRKNEAQDQKTERVTKEEFANALRLI